MIGPSPNPAYDFHNPLGLRLLTRLTLRLSHLNKQKFNDSFKNCVTVFKTVYLQLKNRVYITFFSSF